MPRQTTAHHSAANHTVEAPAPRTNERDAVADAGVRVLGVEERLHYAYTKLSVLAAAYATMTDPGDGGVPADTTAVFDGMEDLIYDVLGDLRAIRAALNSQDAYMPALIADAPEVH
jgi:hypothetical protein